MRDRPAFGLTPGGGAFSFYSRPGVDTFPGMIVTTIHQRDADLEYCAICAAHLPRLGDSDRMGELVGLIETPAGNKLYRIGDNNRDFLCDGSPATDFHQASVSPALSSSLF